MPDRDAQLAALRKQDLDILILGGGINGAGILRDLALRARSAGQPLRVALVEQRHFASGTSGKNSQLIHGGLRYLKYMEFHLVREALRERMTLLRLAPGLVSPLAFMIPMPGLAARFYYGAGLWLYDLLAGRRNIARHRWVRLAELRATDPDLAADGLSGAELFYDCRVNSARLVLANVFDAIANGGIAVNYVRADPPHGGSVPLRDELTGERFEVRARKLIDATGAWSDTRSLRLVRGSHIVLPRINNGDHAIAYFEEQGRIVFFIPWGSQNQLTLVGTTDIDHDGGPDNVSPSAEEIAYLRRMVARLYPAAAAIEPVSVFSSLRALIRDESRSATATTREHRIWNSENGVLHVAGGKYTTYRAMSEEAAGLACRDVAPGLAGLRVTAGAPLAGGPLAGELSEQIGYAWRHEMAQRLADVMFVSTYCGYERAWDAARLAPYAEAMGRMAGWDSRRVEAEISLVLRLTHVPEPTR